MRGKLLLLLLPLLALLLLRVQGAAAADDNGTEEEELLCKGGTVLNYDYLCLPMGYDRLKMPPLSPVLVDINFKVNDVLDINDLLQTVSIRMNLDMEWQDPRMEVSEHSWWIVLNTTLSLGGEIIEMV